MKMTTWKTTVFSNLFMCFFCLQGPGEQRHVLLWHFFPYIYNLIYSKTLAIVEPEVELTTKKTTELLNF